MMLMPLAAVVAILLGRQQQRVATVEQECQDMRRALLTSEAAFSQAPVGLAVLDCDLRFVRVNPLLAAINGMTIEEHAGKTMRDVVPEIAAAAEERIRDVMATGRPLLGAVFEGATAAQPHLRRIWRENIHPLYDRDATLVGVTVVVEEITEQQRVANALQDSRQREQRRTSELEALMQVAPAALFIAGDRECRRIRANPAAERLLRLRSGSGSSSGSGVATNDPGARGFAVYAAGTLLPLDQLPLHRAAATGEAIRDETLTVRFADHDRLHVLINALPLRDEAGEIVGAVAGCIEAPAAAAAAGGVSNAGNDG
jgi:PAS domain S-box-containing protein